MAAVIIFCSIVIVAILALLIVIKSTNNRVKKLAGDVEFLNAGYDALEKQNSERYANESSIFGRIELIEGKMTKNTKKSIKQ